jgi:hypothetical protein
MFRRAEKLAELWLWWKIAELFIVTTAWVAMGLALWRLVTGAGRMFLP